MAGLQQNVASIDTMEIDMDVITKNVGAVQGSVRHIGQTADQSIKQQLEDIQQQASKEAKKFPDIGPIQRKIDWLKQQLF